MIMSGNTNVPRQQGYVERAREAVTEGVEGVKGKMRIAMLLAATSAFAAGCSEGNDGADMGNGNGDDTGNTTEQYPTECSDGEDNDGSGLVDGEDPTCMSGTDGVEGGPCADAFDNDGDGWMDDADPKCWEDPTDASTYRLYDMCETVYGVQTTMDECNHEAMADGDEGFVRSTGMEEEEDTGN